MAQTTPDRMTLYRFKLDRILGKGGTGVVYRGIDPEKGEVVAIKLFFVTFFRNKLHLKDFARSVNKFKKFKHANVAHIREFIQGEEGECLVLEYVDGPDLKWYIENRSWNLQERLVIAAQICNGLQYIHDMGFTHHDLKPSNILFTRKGVVKLVDYSLCGNSSWLTLFDPSVHEQVTPMYIAPELIRNEKATPQSDIYSLGITFYLLFAMRTPFPVDTLQKLYACHLYVTPDNPSMHNPKCPPGLSDIIMRMIDKKPENRFQDCDQLRIALADIGRSRI
ncbi:MAG TPA: serine/threonine-protein kinase [Candidatus Bathyarchaeia archaeon]|nr:serine/threonine-protein kinase [Candidatus Bathyarchaeia archaeon]